MPGSVTINQLIEKFKQDICEILDSDYGDFMRKANVYLQSLKAAGKARANPEIEKRIAEMQLYIQYFPNWNVDSTRSRILKDAEALRTSWGAHSARFFASEATTTPSGYLTYTTASLKQGESKNTSRGGNL